MATLIWERAFRRRRGRPAPFRHLLDWWCAPATDRRLAAGEGGAGDEYLARRASLLTSARVRERIATRLREIVAAAEDPRIRITKAPVARDEVLAAARELRLLASRLQAPAPVDPRGVAKVNLLIGDGRGPLY